MTRAFTRIHNPYSRNTAKGFLQRTTGAGRVLLRTMYASHGR